MQKGIRSAVRAGPGVVLALLVGAASLSPSDATSSLAGWWKLTGRTPPEWLNNPTIDGQVVAVGVALFVLWLVALFMTRERDGPDFDDVDEWSVSADLGNVMCVQRGPKDLYVFKQGCRFANLSSSQAREIDVEMRVPTTHSGLPIWTLSTTNTFRFPYHEALGAKGIENAADHRFMRWLKVPIRIEPNGVVEGQIEFEIHHSKALEGLQIYEHVDFSAGEITLIDRRTGMRRTFRSDRCYDALKQRAYRGRVGQPETWRQWRARMKSKARRRMNKLTDRFDQLLKAMTQGEKPSAGKTAATRPASDAEPSADCGDTQTPPDTSEDASR